MNFFRRLVRFTQLYGHSTRLRFNIFLLQNRIQRCNRRLQATVLDTVTIRALEDERFGCQIEAEALKVIIQRRIAASRSLQIESCKP
jgi:hypothetical protein